MNASREQSMLWPSSFGPTATHLDHIKAKWHLTATPTEWTALTQMAATC